MRSLVDITLTVDELDGWDQLKDYTTEQLKSYFGLSDEDVGIFQYIVMNRTEPRWNTYSLDAKVVGTEWLEMVQEAIHQGFDGWSEREQLVIEAFLTNISYALTTK